MPEEIRIVIGMAINGKIKSLFSTKKSPASRYAPVSSAAKPAEQKAAINRFLGLTFPVISSKSPAINIGDPESRINIEISKCMLIKQVAVQTVVIPQIMATPPNLTVALL